MKRISIVSLLFLLPFVSFSQSYPHYTMFMFDKLLYNPAYAGNKDLTEINASYRDQWTGIDGAPKNINVSIDGTVGSYMKSFRPVAIGLSIDNEQLGVTNNTNIMGYYAYRIPMKNSVLSLGLQAGVAVYNAKLNTLNPYQQNDQLITSNINNDVLPNFGFGAYWSGANWYAGASVPNLLENYYDANHKYVTNTVNKQIRSYYVNGGYVFTLSENVMLEPQALIRYAGNENYNLPLNADFNLSVILYQRLLLGVTYRTDESVDAIIHLQVTNQLNIGYSYDYEVSPLMGYSNGTHELTVGFDFIRDHNKYTNPRFVKMF